MRKALIAISTLAVAASVSTILVADNLNIEIGAFLALVLSAMLLTSFTSLGKAYSSMLKTEKNLPNLKRIIGVVALVSLCVVSLEYLPILSEILAGALPAVIIVVLSGLSYKWGSSDNKMSAEQSQKTHASNKAEADKLSGAEEGFATSACKVEEEDGIQTVPLDEDDESEYESISLKNYDQEDFETLHGDLLKNNQIVMSESEIVRSSKTSLSQIHQNYGTHSNVRELFEQLRNCDDVVIVDISKLWTEGNDNE